MLSQINREETPMQDWEHYYRNGNRGRKNSASSDDPWDRQPSSTGGVFGSRQPESHDPGPDHVIGSCGPDLNYDSHCIPRKKHGALWGVIIIVVAALIICGIGFAISRVFFPSSPVSGLISGGADNYSGDDGFSVNVDPEPDGNQDSSVEPAQEVQEETGPSDIQRYEGDASFSLELKSSQGLEALSYQEIYAKVSPSVVTITVYGDYSGAYATGIILSEDGYILTNQHVVALQSHAQVTTADNQVYDALLVGEDPNSDLALLKVEAQGLTPAEFGTSDELLVGDECFAIGNPLGINYRGSFSNGIVSALNRNVNMNDYTMTLIQTTAALNSGNSGGPLINIYGQVIGVNNMKIMSSETTVEGLGFAIPSTTAQRVVNALITEGTVEHPVLGITCYAVTAGDQDGNPVDGIYVVTVDANSDAAAQGLQPGDIITSLNGSPVYQVGDVDLSGMRVGDSVTVTVYRSGETLDLTFQLVEQNDLSGN